MADAARNTQSLQATPGVRIGESAAALFCLLSPGNPAQIDMLAVQSAPLHSGEWAFITFDALQRVLREHGYTILPPMARET